MEKPHRYPVIFNPKARSQKGGRVLRFLMNHANRLALYATNHAGEARDLAARFAAEGEPVVIAAGGDGTLNEVVSGLGGSKTMLGVLPAGTMNVFAREMGIPFDSLERAFQVIERGFVKEVDLFEANGSPFVQMAGVGFDAMVIEETSWEAKKKLGPLAYLLAAVKVLGETPPRIEVICPDGRREEGVAVLAGNGSLYGGHFRFFRNANQPRLQARRARLQGGGLPAGARFTARSRVWRHRPGGIHQLFPGGELHRPRGPRGAGGGGRRMDRQVLGNPVQGHVEPAARDRSGGTAGGRFH
jgi:diacylglycerol kinase family enzyme